MSSLEKAPKLDTKPQMNVEAASDNCFFKNGLAYTEDGVLIHNVFVYNLSKSATETSISKRFSIFGKIESIRFVANKYKKQKNAPVIAAINYTDASSAARILQCFNSKRSHRNSPVAQPCESWQQPSLLSPKQTLRNADEEMPNASESLKLTMLNDDCLAAIFNTMELADQVRLSMTCEGMKNVFKMICKIKCKRLTMMHLATLTLWEIREFFLIAGPYILDIIGYAPYKCRDRDIFTFIERYCTNLKGIYFDSASFLFGINGGPGYFTLLGKLQNCKVLQLRHCCVSDVDMKTLAELPNLRCLSLVDNYKLTGNYMKLLSKLTDLAVAWCENIKPEPFTAAMESLRELKSLDIVECVKLDTPCLRKIVEYNTEIEYLKMSYGFMEPSDVVVHLPKLKKLEVLSFVSTTEPIDLQFFAKLAKHKAHQLEWLKIDSINAEKARLISKLPHLKTLLCDYATHLTDECLQIFGDLKNLEDVEMNSCPKITNEGLLQLVARCISLKKVVLNDCDLINNLFVLDVIEVLKATYNQRKKIPVRFYFICTGIEENILNNAEYLAAKGLLRISFPKPVPQNNNYSYFYEETTVLQNCGDFDLTCRL